MKRKPPVKKKAPRKPKAKAVKAAPPRETPQETFLDKFVPSSFNFRDLQCDVQILSNRSDEETYTLLRKQLDYLEIAANHHMIKSLNSLDNPLLGLKETLGHLELMGKHAYVAESASRRRLNLVKMFTSVSTIKMLEGRSDEDLEYFADNGYFPEDLVAPEPRPAAPARSGEAPTSAESA